MPGAYNVAVPPMTQILAAGSSTGGVILNVDTWHWLGLIAILATMLLVDILVIHRRAHEVHVGEAAIESAVWIGIGLLFGAAIWWEFGGAAAGEYIGGYLVEKSLSVDNVFVWAVLFAHFQVPPKYQHRVLFWGIFGALAMRIAFIFAGVAIIEKFKVSLIFFGLFLVYSGINLLRSQDHDFDPSQSRSMRLFHRFIPSTDELDGQKLFTIKNGKRLATPLLAVLVLVEITDVIFAVDSVPAVLAVTKDQYLAFASNAFAILGLRALYFLLADMRDRFRYLQTGLGIILAYVGAKMVLSYWKHLPTALSLGIIGTILAVSIFASLRDERRPS